jgi:hypothetical protein
LYPPKETFAMRKRITLRQIRHRAAQIKKAAYGMSRLEAAKAFGITTPDGRPNKMAITHLLNGYIPTHEETLRRWGLLADPEPAAILAEPTRRVLIGAWKLYGHWVGPEEYFGARP